MGLSNQEDEYLLCLWKRSGRISLEELHKSIDFSNMWLAPLITKQILQQGLLLLVLNFGLLGRNLSQLCREILQKEATGIEICKEFLSLCPNLLAQNPQILPKSRAHQVHLDLLRACSEEQMASEMEHKVWAAVANETALAVRYGFKENLFESSNQSSAMGHAASTSDDTFEQSFHLRKVKVELPVRVDFVGGWSDTPPWSLERSGGSGSGLGTSSILSAAVVKALLQITNGDDSNENVTRLVLVLNRSWALEVRLAHQVLQKVVIRYLQRDNLLISSIRRLVELAKIGREALMNCEIDEVGDVMLEAWRLHQELDPYCSNEFVDKLFAFCDPYCLGYKLVGAGGGGFALMLAKTAESAMKLRHLIAENPELDVEVYEWEIFLHK
ncbi:UNVERIFIED_CONTAM: Bifunctional fucokinase/fucose pyrophosphorylase [Sesamum radiatum]|uniref:Bifunctional fucokinase/fucose pyrophosphorylase n=1 Tax=Sesamum radiatum TaxID=300843 RepID=A0AAW2VIE3_SESRA